SGQDVKPKKTRLQRPRNFSRTNASPSAVRNITGGKAFGVGNNCKLLSDNGFSAKAAYSFFALTAPISIKTTAIITSRKRDTNNGVKSLFVIANYRNRYGLLLAAGEMQI